MVCTVRRSAPFSTMCVAQECRSMCGDACRPEAAEASPTICHTRCRVNLRPPRAINSSGEFLVETIDTLVAFFAGWAIRIPASTGRPCARYSDSASCAGLPSGTIRSLSPFPRTSMYPDSNFKSSSVAFTISETRSAPAYNNSSIARSRIASAVASFCPRVPARAAGAANVDSTSSRANDFGNTFHCRGDSIFKVGS